MLRQLYASTEELTIQGCFQVSETATVINENPPEGQDTAAMGKPRPEGHVWPDELFHLARRASERVSVYFGKLPNDFKAWLI